MSGISKKFNPKKLRAARVFAGMSITELADKIDVTKQAISQFEQGKTFPSLENIMKLANVLHFPREYFLEDEMNYGYIGNTFFRSYSTATKRQKESQKERINLIYKIQQYLEQFVNFPSLNLPDLGTSKEHEWTYENIEKLAETVRSQWDLKDKPITNMVYQMEKNGIFVSTVTNDHELIDAFCQKRIVNGKDYFFVVLGNDKYSAVRRQFDAAHELGHILMHSWIDDQDQLNGDELREIEKQADYFAAALLLPRKSFIKSIYRPKLDEFINLKKYWMVSIGAMVVRSYHLGILSYNQYQYIQKQISKRKMRTTEPFDDILKRAEPALFKQTLELLFDSKVLTPQDLVKGTNLFPDLIEDLINLPKNMLKVNKQENVEIVLSLKNENMNGDTSA